ncbi:MAG: hypothetical protein M1548_09205 [Actinobacteria bacterium]|nr:hypothetical protein [Actinomycetota bacterium]
MDANPPVLNTERRRPDGTTETVPIKSFVAVADVRSDGSSEPVGLDKHDLVSIRGVTAHYLLYGNGMLGANSLTFWNSGVEYVIGDMSRSAKNLAFSELAAMAESMIEQF